MKMLGNIYLSSISASGFIQVNLKTDNENTGCNFLRCIRAIILQFCVIATYYPVLYTKYFCCILI